MKTQKTAGHGAHFSVLVAITVGALGCSSKDEPNPIGFDSAVPDATSDTREVGADTSVGDTAADTAKESGPDVAIDTAPDAPEDHPDVAVDVGTPADCLPTTGAVGFDTFFTLGDSSKCIVAQYTVPTTYLSSLTWGRHGGPLGFDGSDATAPKLVRYKVPATATGALAIESSTLSVSGIPTGVFFGSQALDLPFFKWTAISYTGTGTGFPGEILLINDASAIATRYNVNGYFSETATGLAASGGRVLYTGLSPISTTATATNAGGLYAADSCGSLGSTPRLVPAGDATCKDPLKVATWEGGSSGPVATDPNDNVFAILSTFGGNQELRGFEKSVIARGSGATPGTKIFSSTGYTGELVADGKIVVWQPNETLSAAPWSRALDVQAIDYTVDATGKTVTPSGSARAFLTLKTAGTSVALLRDDSKRIWVGVTNPPEGDAGSTSSTFFVLRAKTP
jgi:hypothetical protein